MQTIPAQLELRFREAIRDALGMDADPLICPAANELFGDYQANVAMGLAKGLASRTGQKASPRAVAGQITARLNLGQMAREVSIAGPGFINVRLDDRWLAQQLAACRSSERLGIDPVDQPQRIVVDYSGPNIAKELHVGHLRSTIIGDAIVRVLEFAGHQVIRQNHLGDWGTQFGMLLAYLRESALPPGTHIGDLEDFYRRAKKRFDEDPTFAEQARQAVVRLQSGAEEEQALWKRIVDESRSHFLPLYQRMGVRLLQADERGESFYNPLLASVVQELQDKGIAVESDGAIVVWVEGFESPLIIRKRDGGFGYGTTDLAALRFRAIELRASRIIYVTDARQAQHFRQVFTAARRAGWAEGVQLDHVTFGSILGNDGTPLKTRAGENVKLRDLLDEAEERAFDLVTRKNPELPEPQRRQIARTVGIGAVKYFDLARDRVGDYVFSWDDMLAMDGNTAPYLQYAYARIRSILRKASQVPDCSTRIELQVPQERSLGMCLLRLGEVLQVVARELKPHHLCTYLYELATRFTAFYENCPVLPSSEPVRSSRLALCDLTAKTLALGMDLLGIGHPEQM